MSRRKPKPSAPLTIWIVFDPVGDPYESDYSVYTDEDAAKRHVHSVPGATLFVGSQA